MKKNILIALALIIVALVAYRFTAGASNGPTSMQEKCAIDIHAIILEDKAEQFKTPEQITRAMFDHYFSFYKQIPKCPTDGLADYKIQSVGKITTISELPKAFTAEIVFDLKPLSMDKTLWKSAEATTSSDWILGKKGTLSIRTTVATSSSATTTHYLSL